MTHLEGAGGIFGRIEGPLTPAEVASQSACLRAAAPVNAAKRAPCRSGVESLFEVGLSMLWLCAVGVRDGRNSVYRHPVTCASVHTAVS